MAAQLIPVTSNPTQTLQVTISPDGTIISLSLVIRYLEMAGVWSLTIKDAVSGNLILDSIPLICGEFPAANLLSQYIYLGLGSWYCINLSGTTLEDWPGKSSLGGDFGLLVDATPKI